MAFIKEFKEFAVKGNVIDLAVAVIIGAAFGSITTSLVKDIIMPPLSLVISGVDFNDLNIILKPADLVAKKPEVAIHAGNFINAALQFLLIAFSIFIAVKGINSFKRQKEAAPAPVAPEPAPSKEEILLTEIRDLLAKAQK